MEKQRDIFGGDILLKGKHATYAKFLCPTSEKKESKEASKPADVFGRIMDVYMVGIVMGLTRGIRAEEDKQSNDQVRIFADVVNREKLNLEFIFQLAMLIDNSRKLTPDDKISCAFRNENSRENLEVFNSYARGGIEFLFEFFTSGATTRDDYLTKISDMVKEFKEENSIV